MPVQHADQRSGVTLAAFPAVTARYVRWEVTGINASGYGAVGGAEIDFFTTAGRDALPVRDVLTVQPEQIVLPAAGQTGPALGDHRGAPLCRAR